MSDWSSDVCSADLVARRMLGPMAARSRPHRVVFVVFEGLQGLDLVGPLEVFADANDGLGRAAYELTVAAVEPGQVRTSSGLGVVARSEEHTSELQSLMRISYAVFCLKKKKEK